MPAKRKNPECGVYKVKLCGTNMEIIQNVKAKIRRQCTMSDAVNKFIAECAIKKDHGI